MKYCDIVFVRCMEVAKVFRVFFVCEIVNVLGDRMHAAEGTVGNQLFGFRFHDARGRVLSVLNFQFDDDLWTFLISTKVWRRFIPTKTCRVLIKNFDYDAPLRRGGGMFQNSRSPRYRQLL